jgi:hypothetical protein
MGQDGREIGLIAVGQKERYTVWRHHQSHLMDKALGHGQGPFAHVHLEQKLSDGIDGDPHPVGRPRQALDGFGWICSHESGHIWEEKLPQLSHRF